jgi:hypothetical protein
VKFSFFFFFFSFFFWGGAWRTVAKGKGRGPAHELAA